MEQKQIQELNEKLDKMYLAIVGDDELGVEGLADKVKANSKYIESDKKMKWTAAGIITAASSFINYLLSE
jgi:hypothetical protein